MEYLFCLNCRKETGHKRALGWDTFWGGVVTLGTSLTAIPFYPKRCIVCGRKSDKEPFYNRPLGESSVPAPMPTSYSEKIK